MWAERNKESNNKHKVNKSKNITGKGKYAVKKEKKVEKHTW